MAVVRGGTISALPVIDLSVKRGVLELELDSTSVKV